MPNEKFYKKLLDNLSDGVYFVDRERRIKYWNNAAEVLSGRQAEEVIGSRCADNILVHTDDKGTKFCETGCPLDAAMNDGISRQASVYLLHKAGHRVPINIKTIPLRNNQGKIVGGVETFSDNSSAKLMQEQIQELEKLALIDGLTSAGNRRYADIVLNSRFNELKRYGWGFGVILYDIDNFKRVNDTYGHDMGDEVLKMVARTMAGNVRNPESFFFRWGGEEFLVVLTNVNSQKLFTVAERIRVLVANSALPIDKATLSVTISAGAALAKVEDDPSQIIRRADELLYKSKKSGKNCTHIDS